MLEILAEQFYVVNKPVGVDRNQIETLHFNNKYYITMHDIKIAKSLKIAWFVALMYGFLKI